MESCTFQRNYYVIVLIKSWSGYHTVLITSVLYLHHLPLLYVSSKSVFYHLAQMERSTFAVFLFIA